MKVKVNRELGCKNGGYPRCPGKKVGLMFVNSCKDGTNLTLPYLLNWTVETLEEQWRLRKDFKGCACPDGIMPRWVQDYSILLISKHLDSATEKSLIHIFMITRSGQFDYCFYWKLLPEHTTCLGCMAPVVLLTSPMENKNQTSLNPTERVIKKPSLYDTNITFWYFEFPGAREES